MRVKMTECMIDKNKNLVIMMSYFKNQANDITLYSRTSQKRSWMDASSMNAIKYIEKLAVSTRFYDVKRKWNQQIDTCQEQETFLKNM